MKQPHTAVWKSDEKMEHKRAKDEREPIGCVERVFCRENRFAGRC